jgi:hypothetical protein
LETRSNGDSIKENNAPQADLDLFSVNYPDISCVRMATNSFNCWLADFFAIDAILNDSLPFTGRLPPWDEKGNAVRVIAHPNPQLPPQL